VSIVVFILLGLTVGYVALGIFKSKGKDVVLDFVLGVAGAAIAGSTFSHFAARGGAGVDVASALVAALTGPVVLLAACHSVLDGKDTVRRRVSVFDALKRERSPDSR
jgi:uncharacterized membrane protein YeaQ/YmgE (transglycosylase-associated protein family)